MFKHKNDSGQATTEYALVLLGAAVIALLVIAWATDGVAQDASVNSSTPSYLESSIAPMPSVKDF